MPFTDEEKPTDESLSAPDQELARSLDEITDVLKRMLALAELSASDLPVDRQLLQQTLERLKNEVDRLADGIDL